MPWYVQAGLLVLGMAGSIVIEYLANEREQQDAVGFKDNDEDEPKPSKRRRSA
jgi:hypothetical protein